MTIRCQNIRRGKRCWRIATATHQLTGLRGCRRCVRYAESTSVFGYPKPVFHQSDTESEEESMDKREKHDTDDAGRHRPDCWCK
jgi:hypothetical protein